MKGGPTQSLLKDAGLEKEGMKGTGAVHTSSRLPHKF